MVLYYGSTVKFLFLGNIVVIALLGGNRRLILYYITFPMKKRGSCGAKCLK